MMPPGPVTTSKLVVFRMLLPVPPLQVARPCRRRPADRSGSLEGLEVIDTARKALINPVPFDALDLKSHAQRMLAVRPGELVGHLVLQVGDGFVAAAAAARRVEPGQEIDDRGIRAASS